MKRIALLLSILALSAPSIFAEKPLRLEDAVRRVADGLAKKLPEKTKLVIYEIESDSPEISDYFIEQLTVELLNADRLVVVDRQNLEAIREELSLQASGDVSDESAQRLGAMLGAEVLVTGSFTKMADKYRFAVKAIKVETAEIRYLSNVTVLSDASTETLYGRKTGGAKAGETAGNVARTAVDFSGRLVCSVINPIGGVGSFIQGDSKTGGKILFFEGVSIGAIFYGSYKMMDDPDSGSFLVVAGTGTFIITTIYAIVKPWAYNRNPQLVEALEGVSVCALPDGDLSVGYTIDY
ncbi:MAG TPA: CsgG/HfaB family protein [Treponemataceae bacterium]|nr:CsgG/HfaB family protein [Treponemataceae bacterium]